MAQWSIGLLIDGFEALGWGRVAAFQGALATCWLVYAASFGVHRLAKAHN